MLKPLVLSRRAALRLALLAFLTLSGGLSAARAQAPFSQFIIFGDSLSDTGNDADVSEDNYGFRVPGPGPGGVINYTDGRFTSGDDTDPSTSLHSGVWHEQLSEILGMPKAKASQDGGFNYAYGGATTEDGTRRLDFTDDIGITVLNMGQQVTNYLDKYPVDPAALYVLWGGANDLFVSDTDKLNQTAKKAAKREGALIARLAQAGAVNFLIPNLPRIGNTPRYNGNPTQTEAYNLACDRFGARLFDKVMPNLQTSLAAQGHPVNFYRLDVYGIFGRLLVNQQAYNLYNVLAPSQGKSAQANKFLFWDDVHPTTSGHYQLAVEAFTALTGRPLVQVAPDFTADGFWLTRSGVDLSAKLRVFYSVGGTAAPGADYAALPGSVKIKRDNFTALVKTPATNASSAKDKTVVLGIADSDKYGVGTVTEAQIQYNHPIVNAETVNEQPAAKRAVQLPPLMLPGSGQAR